MKLKNLVIISTVHGYYGQYQRPTGIPITTAIDWENWGVTEARDSEFVTEKSHPFYDAAWYAEWQAYKESLFS